MAHFYPQATAGQHPLTPPYSAHYDHPQYHHDGYPSQQALPPRLDSAMDYTHRYPPPPASTLPSVYQRGSFSGQSLPPINSYYEPVGAPTLPPLRIQDDHRMSDRDYYQSYQPGVVNQPAQQPTQAPSEEVATGGVSAKLDYDMERMTDFVAKAAQGFILPGTIVQPHFRKWMLQVLTATRLPSATILLSLHYLTVRMRDYPATTEKTEHSLYRLLTVSMILGSKFLDDNTFINRSWSDVTSIKVDELNAQEIKWLATIGFDLHADSADPNGVSLWIRAWKEFEARAATKAKSVRLSPLNTDVQRQKSFHAGRSSYQPGQAKLAHGTYTPLSSGSSTSSSGTPYVSSDPWNPPEQSHPEFHPPHSRYPAMHDLTYGGGYNSQMSSCTGAAPYSQFSLPPLHSLAPSFYTSFDYKSWTHQHGPGCHCTSCSRSAPYMFSSTFVPQTVVG